MSHFYGVDFGDRSGYNPEFAVKIRYAQYRQFFWDQLPYPGTKESILRFDQTFPIGHEHTSFQHTGFKLAKGAMFVLDQWLDWYVKDSLPDGDLHAFKELMGEYFT